MSDTVRLLIQMRRASFIGFRRDTSAIGAVEYDFMQRVCEFPNPNIPVDVCKTKKCLHVNFHYNIFLMQVIGNSKITNLLFYCLITSCNFYSQVQ